MYVFFLVGVRYFTRGIDYDGHVANYVETEQIIVYKNHTSSFVQVGVGVARNGCWLGLNAAGGGLDQEWVWLRGIKYLKSPLLMMSHGC